MSVNLFQNGELTRIAGKGNDGKDGVTVTQNKDISETGNFAIDAIENNPDIEGTLANEIEKLKSQEKMAVDETLSEESTNPVQNKVITQKINELDTLIAQANELKEQLSRVAFSGAYNDLIGTPQIPTVPDALKNPHALKFTGAVTGNYDGSEEKTVNIPNIIVDKALSDTSKNPVQNKAISLQVNELKKSVSDGKALVAGAITEKGVQTAADANFTTMAENILAISSEKQFPEIGNNLVAFTYSENYEAGADNVNKKIKKGSGDYDWEYTLITGSGKSFLPIKIQNYSYFSLDSFKRRDEYDFKNNKKEVTITIKWESKKSGYVSKIGSFVMNIYSEYIYNSRPYVQGERVISANLKGMDGYVMPPIPLVPANYSGYSDALYNCFISFFYGEEIVIPLVCVNNENGWDTKVNDATISITQ